MKVGIVGTRGIPNHYGGFGQLAQYLSKALVEKGHEVYVYNSHNHPYQAKEWEGVHIVHAYDPEYRMGTFGQFIYDYNCLKDSRKRKFDVLLQLGYTSNSIWWWMLPAKRKVATNMDGLEWKRSKYNYAVKQFLKVAEWLAAKSSGTLVADSPVIKDYLLKKYQKETIEIAYGAHLFDEADPSVLTEFELEAGKYDLIIARMEPENNIETILQGKLQSKDGRPLIVIGNIDQTPHGRKWKENYKDPNIRFLGTLFDIRKLNNLRHFSHLYFHGHSVGGTNPSLLEAMASNALICAHNNAFNKAVLGDDALYFSSTEDVVQRLQQAITDGEKSNMIAANREKIQAQYSWEKITNDYEALFVRLAKT